MLSNVKNYIIAVLFVLASLFAYVSYEVYGDNKLLEQKANELKVELVKSQEDYRKAKEGWDTTLSDIEAMQGQLDSLDTGLQRDLTAICKPVKATPQTPPQGAANERSETISVVPRDGVLDDHLARVLHDAYCQGAGNDPACRTESNDK